MDSGGILGSGVAEKNGTELIIGKSWLTQFSYYFIVYQQEKNYGKEGEREIFDKEVYTKMATLGEREKSFLCEEMFKYIIF